MNVCDGFAVVVVDCDLFVMGFGERVCVHVCVCDGFAVVVVVAIIFVMGFGVRVRMCDGFNETVEKNNAAAPGAAGGSWRSRASPPAPPRGPRPPSALVVPCVVVWCVWGRG